jgi:hypothetical protein
LEPLLLGEGVVNYEYARRVFLLEDVLDVRLPVEGVDSTRYASAPQNPTTRV